MKTFKQIEKDANLTGLDVYTIPNVWHIDKENKTFHFGSIGVTVSARYYDKKDFIDESGRTCLNKSHWNKFVIEVQYDYRDTKNLNSLEHQKGGTFGATLFSKTIKEGVKLTEEFLNEDFEGILNFKGETQKPSLKISRLEIARISSLHHLAGFKSHIKKDDFRLKTVLNQPKEAEVLKLLSKKYENREKAILKYTSKVEKAFKIIFGFELKECRNIGFSFNFNSFDKLMKLEMKKGTKKEYSDLLTVKQFNTLKHAFKLYS